jgi:methylamine dehydrogenase heavy chain
VYAHAEAPKPPVTGETIDVATLKPAGPHRVYVLGGFTAPVANILEADDEHLRSIGAVQMGYDGLMAVSKDASRIFVVETFYAHGNRGAREDVLSVYDGSTLALLKEVTIPGRLLTVPQPHMFEVSPGAHQAYVYDLLPASRIHIIDLDAGKLATSVDVPGCALALAYQENKFATICGDGTVGTVALADGQWRTTFTKPFFDANADPVFESGCVDADTGNAWFLSYSGQIFPVSLGASVPTAGTGWSINVAAGLPRAGTRADELAWRPGGVGQVMALHQAGKRLYVLMHTGDYWTHKQSGSEVWVLDPVHRSLERRIPLKLAAHGIAVSQDAHPLLYLLGQDEEFAVVDATTGEQLRKRKLSASLAWSPAG